MSSPAARRGSKSCWPKEIVPHAAHHGDLRPQTGALQSLIGALAAGRHVEGRSVNGLSGFGNTLRGGNDVHNEAADYQNAGLSLLHDDYS